jgi:hypothetical protein
LPAAIQVLFDGVRIRTIEEGAIPAGGGGDRLMSILQRDDVIRAIGNGLESAMESGTADACVRPID